jgi:peptidase E
MLPETLTEQLTMADVVYLHGGDNTLLLEELGRYPQIPTIFKDMVVIGSSAGANYLSRYFWARREQRVRKGYDIVPYSVMVHHGVTDSGIPRTDWDEAEALLVAQGGDTPLRLREGHFWVIEQ